MGSQGWFGAIATGSYDQVERLTPQMAGTRNHLGETGLMVAVRLGDDRTVGILEPFERTLLNTKNETALMIAVRCHNVAAAQLLSSAEYCIAKPDGTTALHLAAQLGYMQLVEILEPYLRHTADKSGTLAVPETHLFCSSSRNPSVSGISKPKNDDVIVSSTLLKKGSSDTQLTELFGRHLNLSTLPEQTSKDSALPPDPNSLSGERSFCQSAAITKQSAKSTPRLSPYVRIEMAVTDDISAVDPDVSTAQSTSLNKHDSDLTVCDSNGVTLLSKAASAKRAYVHAQLQSAQILDSLEVPYHFPSFVALSTQSYPGASLSDQAAVSISPLLIVNPFISKCTPHIFDSIESIRSRASLALECLACMVGTAYAADLPSIFICVIPDLISAIVPCRGLQVEEVISNLSLEGTFATTLSPLIRERYAHLARSFCSRSSPPAGHLCDKRYICIRKVAEEEVYRLCQLNLDVCRIYPLLDSPSDNEGCESSMHTAGTNPLPGRLSNFLIQVSGAAKAESLLVYLAFSGYDASILSFYDFTELNLPNEIFIILD